MTTENEKNAIKECNCEENDLNSSDVSATCGGALSVADKAQTGAESGIDHAGAKSDKETANGENAGLGAEDAESSEFADAAAISGKDGENFEDSPKNDEGSSDSPKNGEDSSDDIIAGEDSVTEDISGKDSGGEDSGNQDPPFSAETAPQAGGDIDEDAVRAIRAEWKSQNKIKRLTPFNTLLMLGVLGFVPWYIWGERQDIAYFFSSGEPADLGRADSYAMEIDVPKPEYPDNRYVRVRGIPIRQVGISSRSGPIGGSVIKLVYQLMGSPVYIEELAKDSKYADFISKTTSSFSPDATVEPVDIVGRMRRFDADASQKYVPVRNYFSEKYGTVFCENMSAAERKRKAALLGRGGVSVQIMPDGSVIQADTQTRDTLIDVEPLRGRAAVAIGKSGTLLHTIDAGLTWRKTTLGETQSVLAVAYNAVGDQILFGGKNGWTGQADGTGVLNALPLTQDIRDLAFAKGSAGDGAPAMIAVGREGLIEIAYPDSHTWMPAEIDSRRQFYGIMRDGNTWFAVGSDDTLMYRNDGLDGGGGWIETVSPLRAKWFGITKIPGYAVAVGSGGAVARMKLDDARNGKGEWTIWPHDDVPGIDFGADLRASAVSDDGKTWVGVGSKGAIVMARADASGSFGRIRRISGSYGAYGFLDDFENGVTAQAAVAAAAARHTDEDLYDVAYAGGLFYAVGENSTLMTSPDGLRWEKRPLHVKGKTLRAIAFTPSGLGFIGGEKGTLLTTSDGGKIWRSKTAPTERSIYDIAVSPDYPNGFVFAGAYGLWGFCETVGESKCYLRSRTGDIHYRAIEFDKGAQKSSGLRVVAAGDGGHIDKIEDDPRDKRITALWTPDAPNVYAMALSDSELPLKPDAPRGQIDLIAAQSGSVYRSGDGGYVFKREQTGLRSPIKQFALTPNGSIVLAFDRKGHARYDIDARRKWRDLDPDGKLRPTGGVIIPNPSKNNDYRGYLIDGACLFDLDIQKLAIDAQANIKPQSGNNSEQTAGESQKSDNNASSEKNAESSAIGRFIRPVACLSPENRSIAAIDAIAQTDSGLILSVRVSAPAQRGEIVKPGQYIVGFSGDALNAATANADNQTPPKIQTIPLSGEPVIARFSDISDDYRLIACGSPGASVGVIDDAKRTLTDKSGERTENVFDAVCIGGNIVPLVLDAPADGRSAYRLRAGSSENPLWSVAFDGEVSAARVGRNASGRLWLGVVAKDAAQPQILMSSDGKSWSWRRDIITDFNAVATAQNYAVAVGDFGAVYVSQNSGKSWTSIPTSTKFTLRGVCISSDAEFAVAVGDGGTVYRSKSNLMRWSKLNYKLDIDLTSCAIAEQKDRFQTYIAGKGGAIYATADKSLGKLDLIASPAVEDIYSLAALETGEVIAVGGVYQDPDTICEEGFLVELGESPRKQWPALLIALLMAIVWAYTLKTFIISIKHRRDFDKFDDIGIQS